MVLCSIPGRSHWQDAQSLSPGCSRLQGSDVLSVSPGPRGPAWPGKLRLLVVHSPVTRELLEQTLGLGPADFSGGLAQY